MSDGLKRGVEHFNAGEYHDALDAFEDGATVDLQAVLTRGLASLNTNLLKVLGNGNLSKKLTVRAHKFSKSAEEKIKAAGGEVVTLQKQGHAKKEAKAK